MNNPNFCSRTRCNNSLRYGHYNIKNDNTDAGRNYCGKCGPKIVELNPGIEYKVFNGQGELLNNIHFTNGEPNGV